MGPIINWMLGIILASYLGSCLLSWRTAPYVRLAVGSILLVLTTILFLAIMGVFDEPDEVMKVEPQYDYQKRLFTGRVLLKEANLYDYRNRVYSAELGRFLQTDPIQFDAGDGNLYRYVGNKVGVFVDPFGLEEKCCPEGKWSGRGTYIGAGAIIGFGWFGGEMKCDSDSSYKAYVKGRMWPFGFTVGTGINSLDLSVSGAKKKSDLVDQTGVFFVLSAKGGNLSRRRQWCY
jgi:RHS repeat-associated protein